MRATRFYNVNTYCCLLDKRLLQALQRRDQHLRQFKCTTYLDTGRYDVVTALGLVHIIVRMNRCAAKMRHDFIHIHVGTGSGTCLKHINRELFQMIACCDRQRMLDNQTCLVFRQQPQRKIGGRCCRLDDCKPANKHFRHGLAGQLKIVDRPLCLRAIQSPILSCSVRYVTLPPAFDLLL